MPTQIFTRFELAAHGVPPDSPDDVEYSETVLCDEPGPILKYSRQRRVVFRYDGNGKAYSLTYEAPIDTGDHEVHGGHPDDHGWHGPTVEGVEVELRPVVRYEWEPVDERQPATPFQHLTALEQLTAVYEELGHSAYDARQWAAELLHKQAADLPREQAGLTP